MAAVTVADRRRSVISAVFCTLVVPRIPVLQLQRHHRSHIPLPTSSLQKTGRPGRMTVPTIRSDTVAFTGGGFPEESENTESDSQLLRMLIRHM